MSQKEKIAKDINKKAIKYIKSVGKKYSVGTKGERMFTKSGNMFFHSLVSVAYVNAEFILYGEIKVKPFDLDDLFWEVFDAESNKNEPISFRASGAYVAPSAKTKLIKVAFNSSYNIGEKFKKLLDSFGQYIGEFKSQVSDVESYYEYLKNNQEYELNELLWILLDIHLGNYAKAIEMLQQELSLNKTGGFSVGDKDIYEYAEDYCKNRLINR